MAYSKHTSIYLKLLFLALILVGCKHEFQRPELENDLLVPLIKTKLSIQEIVPDSLQNTSTDNEIELIYRNPLYEASLSSFRELETREFEQTAKLQSLVLSTRSAERAISLGQVVEGAGLGAFIQHGSNQIIPPIPGLSYGPLPVDGTAFFETVTLDSGFMDVTIQNLFPTGLQNIDFEIRNASDNSLVGSENFTNVPAGETRSRTIDLAGKTVEGNLLGDITNFDVTGTGATAVLIDTNDQILLTITVRDMKVNSATAIFPAQEVVNLKDTTAMENVGDLRITKAKAKTGYVDLRVISTLEDTIFFNYFIPEGKKDGIPLEREISIAPSPDGSVVEDTFNLRVDGYTFDLTGAPVVNAYNAFYSELSGRIDSTGEVVSLSLQDSIRVFVKLRNFIPEYVEGYLGNNSLTVGPEAVPVSLFRSFYSGSVSFEDVTIDIGVENGNGVPFNVALNTLEAVNTRSNTSVALNLNSLPELLEIPKASSLSLPSQSNWSIGKNNSNVEEVLNVFPNRFNVALEVTSNPALNENDLDQFAVDTNSIKAFADIRLPLSLIAEDLVIADTVAFDNTILANTERIQSGIFYMILENTLPLGGSIQLDFIDEGGNVLESIVPQPSIPAGNRNQAVTAVLEWPFIQAQLLNMSVAERVVVRARMNTNGSNYQQIYSDQTLQLTLSARFAYIYEND